MAGSGGAKPLRRRAVLDNARRKVERSLAVADAAEELAKAVEVVVAARQAEGVAENDSLRVLRAALARYRQLS